MFTQMFTHQEGGWGRPENLSLPGQSAGRSATPNTTQSGGKMVSGAHMSRIRQFGLRTRRRCDRLPSDAGDTPGVFHDHFECHPNVMPSQWPASPYGYSTYDGAINPYRLLVAACA